jgi:hypothetical protein
MEHKCQKSKKMRMREGLQVLDPDKMGLQVLDPAQGCNGQVRPGVVLHGNGNLWEYPLLANDGYD